MSNALHMLHSGKLQTDFSWNSEENPRCPIPSFVRSEVSPKQIKNLKVVAEDLRDGIAGVREHPDTSKMIEYVDLLYKLGVRDMTVGIFAGTGKNNKVEKSTRALLKYLWNNYKDVHPIVLSLTSTESLDWTARCKDINPNLHALVFMGTAPSRMLVEEWDKELILKKLGSAIKLTVKRGIPVIGGSEHTTQTPPDFLTDIIKVQVGNGAKIFCIADTIGVARPRGTYRIVKFVKKILKEIGAQDVLIDWHGHDDMANGVANAMVAIAAGANRVHVVARGIGERAGNTRTEGLLVNFNAILKENELPNPWNMSILDQVLQKYSEITNTPIPFNGPLGERAFRTQLGIHASALLKTLLLAEEANKKGFTDLANKLTDMFNTIYTSINPTAVGRTHEILVGPWSGAANVKAAAYLLFGIHPLNLKQTLITKVLSTAKILKRELTNDELRKFLNHNHHS